MNNTTALSRLVFRAVLCLLPCGALAAETEATTAARAVLSAQREAWNRADVDAFMKGYWSSDDLRFASGDTQQYGWKGTVERYRKTYPNSVAMGKLDFDLVEVRELNPDTVYVFGKWSLVRSGDAKDKPPHGLFTLIVEKKDGTWVITRDHTSASDH